MKRILWLLYLLMTLGQVALDRERPEVFLAELDYFIKDKCPAKSEKVEKVSGESGKICKSF